MAVGTITSKILFNTLSGNGLHETALRAAINMEQLTAYTTSGTPLLLLTQFVNVSSSSSDGRALQSPCSSLSLDLHHIRLAFCHEHAGLEIS